jgi:hypothetical protein
LDRPDIPNPWIKRAMNMILKAYSTGKMDFMITKKPKMKKKQQQKKASARTSMTVKKLSRWWVIIAVVVIFFSINKTILNNIKI